MTEADEDDPFVESYLRPAVREIDQVFGRGYAAAHASLVGLYVLATAIDAVGGSIATSLKKIAKRSDGIDDGNE